ncbi:MAG: class I SAM-dependent methyltransferase [Burkholderiales bacterium]|nr:MAG: class I SAM-dependent methyltransferase [Burkholderiales bacterium]
MESANRSTPAASRPHAAFHYTGRDNLEAMRAAHRYNGFLLDLVRAYARRDDRILDFGAGIGTFAFALKAAGYDVRGLEIDPEKLELLRSGGLDACQNLDEVPDGELDFVYSFNVLEHIEDDVGALCGLRAKMRSGALLLAYVPAFGILYSGVDVVAGHVRRYTRGSLEDAMAKAGFRVRESRYADSLGFAAALAYRVLGGDGTLEPRSVRIYDRYLFPASRALDRLFDRVGGKNVYALAEA